jgi:Suppressor of fused protein (SUFU)
MTSQQIYSKLSEHLNKTWAENVKERFTWDLGNIREVLPNFSVIQISPHAEGEPWVYVTFGAWEVICDKSHRKEFFILSPMKNARHVETLTMLASYYACSNNKIDIGSCIAIGRPWLENSGQDRLLVQLPYPYGPELELCQLNDVLIKFLWVLPISDVEQKYLSTMGLEALEEKFEEQEIDYLNPNRNSVV